MPLGSPAKVQHFPREARVADPVPVPIPDVLVRFGGAGRPECVVLPSGRLSCIRG